MTPIDREKRALLFGRRDEAIAPVRPPWALAEPAFLDACTACGDCIQACPEQILVRGDGRYPQIDFRQGACTFCEHCADACGSSAFQEVRQSPWSRTLSIATGCLARNQIVCQSCADACEAEAIRFRPQLGGGVQIELMSERCNACGACIGSCPVAAIEFKPIERVA